jgi:ribosome-associated protein
MSTDYPIVTISTQPIELCKLLKIANMVTGGGEAKIVISEGYVYLNGEVEFQKRKKIYEQDIIEFNGDIVQVECVPKSRSSVNESVVKKPKVRHKKAKVTKPQINNEMTSDINNDNSMMPSPSKRRPISF